MTSAKRLDLQGIRGFAILAVLGFHFYPDRFPNGYLGVDQFFVLSGFLMCMLLKRSENEAACTLISLFYSKRFKRILPLYLILIFISMICLYYFFPGTAIDSNRKSASKALMFLSNRPQTEEENYFRALSAAIDIFTHTWSLSVEIQFYFLVPFLFLLGSRIPNQKFQYAYYSIISLVSFIFFFISPDTVAFNSVFARIWQFSIGTMVYLAGNQVSMDYRKLENQEFDEEMGEVTGDKEEPSETVVSWKFHQDQTRISYVLLLFLFLMNTYPVTLKAEIVRPLVTVGTGFLMLVSKENRVLSNRLLTYIGDISYSLYLIHWPFYAYWKLTCDGDQKLLLFALVSSVILAIICFETYEKWYLNLSSTSIGILCILLLSLNVLLINKENPVYSVQHYEEDAKRLDDVYQNMTVDDAIKMNDRWTKNDAKTLFSPTCQYEQKGGYGIWCSHQNLSSTGKYKLAIIGNSWTVNHANLFYQECGYKAKSILQGAPAACEPLYPTIFKKINCGGRLKEFQERIEKEKPDIAFIITRYISIGEPFPKNVTTFDQDPIYQMMKTQMLKYISNIKYKLFIVDAIPRINPKVVKEIAPLLKTGTDPVDIDNRLVLPHHYQMARRRHAQLMKDCNGKCELIDYLPEFYNNSTETFRYFDEKGFSYWTQIEHLTPHGLEHVRHIWTDVCRKL